MGLEFSRYLIQQSKRFFIVIRRMGIRDEEDGLHLIFDIRLMTPDQPDLPIGTRMQKFMGQVCATLAYRAAFAEVDGLLIDQPTGEAPAAGLLVKFRIREH